jgi:hypothetical protein
MNPVIIIVFALWLCILTGGVIWIFRFFRTLSQNTGEKDLIAILRDLSDREGKNTKRIEYFGKEIEKFREENITHTQKFGFVRFNPFNDMGGDHSFCVALLDGRNTGFVLTGLHTRERTRVYVKHIKRGKSEYDLSKEEMKALQSALKQ